MTYVVISLSQSEIGFKGINHDLMDKAVSYIRENLQSATARHDDAETRRYDARRTHMPMKDSSWTVVYKGDKVLVTNQISDSASHQFKYLTEGNCGTSIDGYIYAKHMTRRLRKGWSSKDGHRMEPRGKKPIPGTYGPAYRGMLKFYDKHSGMWQYRQRVRCIDSAIISDMNRSIQSAVQNGLESAQHELYDQYDRDTEGADEAYSEYPMTWEEEALQADSFSKTKRDRVDYVIRKIDEEEQTKESQKTEDSLQKAAAVILGEPVPTKTGKIEGKSWFTKVKEKVSPITDVAAEVYHKFFGV